MKTGDKYNPYMTFQGCIVPNCIMKRTDLTLAAKLCFGRLSQYAGNNGLCYPSFKQLADELGVSETTAERAIKDLISANLIAKQSPVGVQRLMHFKNMYTFVWDESFSESPKNDAPEPSKMGYEDPQKWGIKKENQIKENHTIISEKKNSAKRFIKPTIEELTEYCKERGNNIDPQHFFDYQEARAWLFKNGGAIKDWRAVIRTWERNSKNRNQQQNQPQNENSDPVERLLQQYRQERSDEF